MNPDRLEKFLAGIKPNCFFGGLARYNKPCRALTTGH